MFYLTPFKVAEDSADRPGEVLHSYTRGWFPADKPGGVLPEGVIQDQEPSVHIGWSKARQDGGEGPGDQGYVEIQVEVTPEWLRRTLDAYEARPHTDTDVKVPLVTASLSWRDLNVLAKTARTARDDAFGSPQ
jgi:hypothetical protein